MLNTVLLGLCFGLAGLFVLPAALRSTKWGAKVGNAYAGFVAWALRRPAITVGKHTDLTLRQLETDDVFDTEVIDTGGVERKVSRAGNVHRLGSTPLAFVDEVYGVTFDLRDVLVAAREHRLREDGQIIQTYEEYAEGKLKRMEHYFRAFFEFDDRPALSLDLDQSVRPVVDGSEKAHWHERMDEAVRRMFLDRKDGMSTLKLLLPGLGFGAGLLLGYYLLGPGQMPGSSGSTPIDVGLLGLTFSTSSIRDWFARARERASEAGSGRSPPDIPWRAIGKLLLALAVLGVIVAAAVTLGVVWTAVALGSLLAGAALIPLCIALFGALGKGAALGELLLSGAFMGFREPTLDLRKDDRYEIVEAEDVDLDDPPRHKFAKTLVRFSCDVDAEAFGHAGYDASDVEDVRDRAVADGDYDPSECLPRGYEPTGKIERGTHQAYVPSDADPSSTFVRSDAWLSRFKDAATGSTLDVAEKEARKQYAAGDADITDGRLMLYSILTAAVGFGFWVVFELV